LLHAAAQRAATDGKGRLFSPARTGMYKMYKPVSLCHGDCLSWSVLLVRNVEVDGDV